jgi:hypothetical protein
MPSTPRRQRAATTLAVLLAVLLALVWLRSSDGVAPSVPAGLSVRAVPAAVPPQPAGPVGMGRERGRRPRVVRGRDGRRDVGGHRVQANRRKRAARAAAPPAKPVVGEDARARRERRARGWMGPDRQHPPAAALAPGARSDGVTAEPAAPSPEPPVGPEFAIG